MGSCSLTRDALEVESVKEALQTKVGGKIHLYTKGRHGQMVCTRVHPETVCPVAEVVHGFWVKTRCPCESDDCLHTCEDLHLVLEGVETEKLSKALKLLHFGEILIKDENEMLQVENVLDLIGSQANFELNKAEPRILQMAKKLY